MDEPGLLAEDSSGTLEFAQDGSYKIRASTLRSVWRDFENGLWTVEEDDVSEDGEFEYRRDGSLRLAGYEGFVAAEGNVVVLKIDEGNARGMIVAFAQARDADFTRLDLDTTVIGFWLELEGRHIGVVTILGSWKLRRDTYQIDAPIRKEKWEGFPHEAGMTTEIGRVTPKSRHVMSSNGAFGPRGDGTDVDIVLPDQSLALLFARFDIMTAARSESVRGFMFGVPR